ncbi:hypothetical protein PCK2_000886 [Pneumocystis canis]|nr:hypothetical protein PCK2_000886 [Pneumocystis canis]
MRCLLNTIYILEKYCCYLLVASTDGFITIWDITDYITSLEIIMKIPNNSLSSPIWKDQLHQSNIKSMILNRIRDGEYLLITGGDDNKINIIKVVITLDTNFLNHKISCQNIINKFNAHDSSVIGLALSTSGLLISIAADQKLKIWKINSSQLIFLSEFYTYVSDPSGISLVKTSDKEIIVVYGIVLEVFLFNV